MHKNLFNLLKELTIKDFFNSPNPFLPFIGNETLLPILISILCIFVSAFLFYLTFDTPIHEYCHYLGILRVYKNTNFKGKPTKEFHYKTITKAYMYSDFYDFVMTDTKKYAEEIREIAKAGILYSFLLYTYFTLLFLAFSYIYSILFLIGSFFFAVVIILSLVNYKISDKEKYDKEGNLISQPDRFLVKHPEQFKNIHK